MLRQRTLTKSVSASGIAIHTGKSVAITLQPADINTGIIFRRIDLHPPVEIPATTHYVGDTRLNTTLTHEGVHISTVEHVLSALAGYGIDNVYVDIDNAEPPVMDGSALAFTSLIEAAGITEQDAPKKFLLIKKTIRVEEDDKFAVLAPHPGAKFSFTIDFDHPAIKATQQTAEIDLMTGVFAKEISGARTFGFLSDYEYLKKNQLAQGASLENTVVLDDKGVMNEGGLRYENEFVRHKILDAIGDLFLLQHNVIGAFTGYKSGHALSHQLRLALLSDPTAYEVVTWEGEMPSSFAV
ncbi:MAG: UDP-3-0-acyl N-acetylglucosamine deacetylase [Gammaproteobacteria bacterium]|jgi:UDP-3-O-[3-hydroxymyristoyl] N-acetylglucosamine deacetylase|nr:UDP-3-0-acyl N-acetylglucosamine deacetylase [Gammaproteobacteria bacterium]